MVFPGQPTHRYFGVNGNGFSIAFKRERKPVASPPTLSVKDIAPLFTETVTGSRFETIIIRCVFCSCIIT